MLDRLIGVIKKHRCVSSNVGHGLAAFNSDMLYGGDNSASFYLFGVLCECLVLNGWLTSRESVGANSEYQSFVMSQRARHVSLDTMPDVVNIIEHLSSCDALVSRPLLWKVFQLSCLILEDSQPSLPPD